ncbi:hypothetical protein CONPUDRAFT_34507, partial [Coniophora puteana RWD-64-598 SS2]
MVYRTISEDIKIRALDLVEQGHEHEEVARILKVSEKSISRWFNSIDEKGSLAPARELCGRPAALNEDVKENLRQLLIESPNLYLDEIVEWLALFHHTQISTSALSNTLISLGLTRKVMGRVAAQRDEAARDAWRRDVAANFTAEQLVFTDESSKDGYEVVRIVEGSVDGEIFFDFIVNDLLPTMNRYPAPRSVLVMDNCAIHKSEAVREVVD